MSINEKCWYKDVCTRPELGKECSMCRKYLEMNYLMEHSGLPKAKQKPIKLVPTTEHDIKQFDKLANIKDNINEFVHKGENLYIVSDCTGNGKTSWAIKMMHRYFETIWDGNCLKPRALFVSVPTLLMELKNFNKPLSAEYMDLLKNCDLIVWDDIGSTMLSNYDITWLTVLIDGRMLAEKSNIYTGNIVDKQILEDIVGPRLVSRIYNASEIIELDGGDNRHGRSSSTADTE